MPHDEQPHNLSELREVIVTACRNLEQQMIRNSLNCSHGPARRYIRAGGHAFADE
jgi:hypothetical protein